MSYIVRHSKSYTESTKGTDSMETTNYEMVCKAVEQIVKDAKYLIVSKSVFDKDNQNISICGFSNQKEYYKNFDMINDGYSSFFYGEITVRNNKIFIVEKERKITAEKKINVIYHEIEVKVNYVYNWTTKAKNRYFKDETNDVIIDYKE